jgi:hypothetical protein
MDDACWQDGCGMPSDRNWARDPRYDDAALEQFEERLRRARPGSRPGYLRVKGATLLDHRDPAATLVAIRLLHRATESGHFLEVPWAHELLGKAYRKMGDLDAAEHHYRRCMATVDEHGNGTTKVTKLFLAEVLLQRDDRGDLAEVEELLSSPDLTQSLLWNSYIFRYYVAQARLALRQRRDPREWAALALELAGDRRPQLPRHPTVGLVDPDPEVIAELRVLVHGDKLPRFLLRWLVDARRAMPHRALFRLASGIGRSAAFSGPGRDEAEASDVTPGGPPAAAPDG